MPTKEENILRNAKIVTAIKSGKSYAQISERFLITKERVRQIGIKEGLISVSDKKRERNELIIKDYRKEKSTQKLVIKYKLSFSRIVGVLQENGFSTEFKANRITRNKKIAALFRQGLSCVQIKAKYNMTYANILRILHMQGLYSMISPKEYPVRNDNIIADIKSGKRYAEISKKYSIGTKRIMQIAAAGEFQTRKVIKLRNVKIAQEFEKGTTKKKLALKYKLAVSTIKSILIQEKKRAKIN